MARSDSRYAIPRLPKSVISRPRLLNKLRSNRGSSLIQFQAPSGYGKSVLAAQYIKSLQGKTAWLNLDSEDSDVGVLSRSVARAVNRAFPNVRLKAWEGVSSSNETIDRLAKVLASDFNALDDDLVIVLETLEYLSSDSGSWLSSFAARLGEGHQLITTSFGKAEARFSRLIADGRATSISEKDLRFTESEITKLFGSNAHDTSTICQHLNGWPAAVGMVRHGAVLSASPDDLIHSLIDKLPPDIRGRLAEAAPFEQWTYETIEAPPTDWLNVVLRSGLPLVKLTKSSYKPHALLLKVLDDQLSRRPELYAKLHSEAGHLLKDQGNETSAIEHFANAGAMDEAVILLEAEIPRYQKRSDWSMARRILEPLKRDLLTPYLRAMLGISLMETGDGQKGAEILKAEVATENAHAYAYWGLALGAQRMGKGDEASVFLDEAEELTTDKRTKIDISRFRAGAYLSSNRIFDAYEVAVEAVSEAERWGETGLLIHTLATLQHSLYRLDRFEKALEVGDRVLDIAVRKGETVKAMSSVMTQIATLMRLGMWQRSASLIRDFLPEFKDYPLGELHLLDQQWRILHSCGHIKEAIETMETLLPKSRKAGINWVSTQILSSRVEIAASEKQMGKVEEFLSELTHLCTDSMDDQMLLVHCKGIKALAVDDGIAAARYFADFHNYQLSISQQKDWITSSRLNLLAAQNLLGELRASDINDLAESIEEFDTEFTLHGYDTLWNDLFEQCIRNGWHAELFKRHLNPEPIPLPNLKEGLWHLDLLNDPVLSLDGKSVYLPPKLLEIFAYLVIFEHPKISKMLSDLYADDADSSVLINNRKRLSRLLQDAGDLDYVPIVSDKRTYKLNEDFVITCDVNEVMISENHINAKTLLSHLDAVAESGAPPFDWLEAIWSEISSLVVQQALNLEVSQTVEVRLEIHRKIIAIDPLIYSSYESLIELSRTIGDEGMEAYWTNIKDTLPERYLS